MRNLIKAIVLLLVLCQSFTSCTKNSISEEQDVLELSTEGGDNTPKEEKDDPNQ